MSKEDYLLASVQNALRVLRSFTINEPEKSVTELSNSLALGKSTVSRLLSTLASEGFVIKDPKSRKYRLGLSILNLNTVLTRNLEITREAESILEQLVHEIEETVHIAVLDDVDVIYLNQVECKHPVQILSHIGRRNPAYCTSSGKMILAYQDEEMIERVINNGFKKYTVNTITDPDDFRSILPKIKSQGYAVSIEEFREGVTSIAAPIYDYTGKVVYALSVIGPVHRMNAYNTTIITKVKRAAKEISERIGYWKY